MNNKYDDPIVLYTAKPEPVEKEESTFSVIVRQLGGGAWAESIAREILSEAPIDGREDR